ncbi:MAG TPA: hypothetical protein V6D20_03195 [Candidatus Obscuribacterales bacterium]
MPNSYLLFERLHDCQTKTFALILGHNALKRIAFKMASFQHLRVSGSPSWLPPCHPSLWHALGGSLRVGLYASRFVIHPPYFSTLSVVPGAAAVVAQ